MNTKDLYEEIRKIIIQETKYNRFFDGVVAELREGKALCTIDSLAWDTNDKGAICTYIDKNSMTELKVGDNVIIGFRDNNPARAFIIGMANDFNLQSPTSYNFNTKIETIYDDRSETQEAQILKDNGIKEFSIALSTGWNMKINVGQHSMETTLIGITIEDTNGNKIASSPVGWSINTGVESFLKGTTWLTNWTTMAATISGATSGNESQNASGIGTIKAAIATFATQLANMLSLTIKGE